MSDELDSLLSEADAASAELDSILGDDQQTLVTPLPGAQLGPTLKKGGPKRTVTLAEAEIPASNLPAEVDDRWARVTNAALAKDPNATHVILQSPDGPVEMALDPEKHLVQMPEESSEQANWRRLLATLSGGSLGMQVPMSGLVSMAQGKSYGEGAEGARKATDYALRNSSMAWPILGGVLSSGPGGIKAGIPIASRAAGAATLGRGAALGARLAMSGGQAGTSAAVTAPQGERLGAALPATAAGVGFGALGEAASQVPAAVGRIAGELPERLRGLGRQQAVRALNPTQPQLRSWQQQQIAGMRGDEAVGEALLREGVIQPWETIEQVAERLAPRVEARGQEVGDWIARHQDLVGYDASGAPIPSLSTESVARRIERDVVRPRLGSRATPGMASSVSQRAGAEAQREAELLREMVRTRRMPPELTLRQLTENVKRPHQASAAAYAKNPATAPETREAAAEVYSSIRGIEDEVAAASLRRALAQQPRRGVRGMGTRQVAQRQALARELGAEGGFPGTKQRYAPLAAAEQVVTQQLPGALGKRNLSPTDYAAALMVTPEAAEGAARNIGEGTMERLAWAVAHKLIRERGNTTAAKLAWEAAPYSPLVGKPLQWGAQAAEEATRYGIPAAMRQNRERENMSRATPEDDAAVEAFLRGL